MPDSADHGTRTAIGPRTAGQTSRCGRRWPRWTICFSLASEGVSAMVRQSPFAWVEAKALDFPGIWDAVSRHHPWSHPVSYYLIAVIFFEETGFCDIAQARTSGSLGVGFGQLEV